MRRNAVRVLVPGVALLLASTSAHSHQPHWRLNVEQRFVLDEGPAAPISDLRDFAVGVDGRLYVLENTVKQVHVYLPNGRYSKSFSRSGSGPGEIRDANGIITLPDRTLWVNDHGNQRLNVYAHDGEQLRPVRTGARGYGCRWTAFVNTAGIVHDELIGPLQGTLARRRSDGVLIDTLNATHCPGNETPRKTFISAQSKGGRMARAIPFVQRSLVAYDPRGAKWCINRMEYRIARVDLRSGRVVAEAVRDIPRTPIPRSVREAAIASIRADVSKYESTDADYSLVPNEYPFVESLTVDDQGRLWVLRPQPDSSRTSFDIFDERGAYLASALLAERSNSYLRVLVRGDLLYAVALDPDDVPSIVRARVIRGAR
ncbi:MAG: hypothetical protein ACREOG_11925 [Gemmatimonadaceae bacterium]